ncbi:hypothetical protein Rhopal_005832-T1 [Rhodotorula paludigena]|uniref:GCF C-terminal domain-containing protein n=1 Tax=Rhodotorula paludigena TaxID=86838 RepID=A0AAV5GU92_9BASI|nr:hypothetical protein Rhopal_005832-T1 [Rhodotorula paludigena]
MDGDDAAPAFAIKKRSKARPSSISLRPSTSSLSLAPDDSAHAAPANDEAEGNVAVFRSRGKKTPAGRVKDREAVKARSRISFGGDDDDNEDSDSSVVVKRSTPSSTPRRLLRPSLPASSSSSAVAAAPALASPATPAEPSPARSVYSKEYLDELKRGQLNTPRGGAAAAEASAGDGFDDLTRSKFGTERMYDAADSIPTTDAISRAKARREEMRKAGVNAPARGEDGFISLEVGFANKGGDSRLVREEDELGDGDEDLAAYTDSLSRLPLGKRANAAAARQLRAEMTDLIDDVEMDVHDDDAEMRDWEEAQIRRGGEQRRREREGAQAGAKHKGPYRPAPIPQSSTLPSLAAVTARLSAALSTLGSSHTLDSSSLAHFEQERAELDKQEQELRAEVDKVERKSRWFEEFKEQVEDWGAFLDEKFPQLEKIEDEYLAIQRERYSIIAARRFADDSDDVALFTGAALPSTFRPLPPSDAPASADEDLPPAPAESPEDLEPRSVLRTTRRAERERRRVERPQPASSAYPDLVDSAGYDTDATLAAGHVSDLSAALASLEAQLAALFADVKAADFRDPNLGIRARFEQWRERFAEEYEMTFAGLSLVQVWEFWARVEMASWNPFEIAELPRSAHDLAAYQWHQNLSSYGHRPHAGATDDDDDEDKPDESTEVVNALVTSVCIPRLEKLARAAYDPLSSRQTVAALRVVDEISYCVEPSSPKFESLMHAFLYRLRLAIASSQSIILPHLAALSLPSLAYDPTTFLARQSFLHRQLKLVRTCARWRRFLRALRVPAVPVELRADEGGGTLEVGAGASFDELVQRELVAKTVLPVIEAAWASGGEEVARKIIDALPKDIPPALRRRLEGEQVGGR